MARTAPAWFKSIRWQSFPRDFAVIQFGFALFGLGIAMIVQANLGTNPWVVLNVALANLTGWSIGTFIAVVGAVVLVAVMALREPVGWGTLGNILFIGPWTDLFLKIVPSLEADLVLQVLMLLAAVLVMGLATAIYISVDAGAGPRDSLMLAVARVTPLSLRAARAAIEVTVVAIGWILGGPVGLGTVVFAALIGPAVQAGFRLLKMEALGKKA